MAVSVVSRAAGMGAFSAAGQLIIIGSLPAYSRLFDPGPYGEYLIFVGAVGVVSVFAGVRYDSAIVLPRNSRVAGMLTAVVMLIAVAVAILIAGATLLSDAVSWAPARWLAREPGWVTAWQSQPWSVRRSDAYRAGAFAAAIFYRWGSACLYCAW